jgi:hypothetical protein
MKRSVVLLVAALAAAALAQAQRGDYTGPQPPKPDVPYLMHADNLIETEVVEAREDKRKSESLYTIPGAASPARTPLAEPIFLFQSGEITPDTLELYRLEVKGGNRQAMVARKRNSRPFRLTVTRLADRLYRIEVNRGMGLENGEYSLSPNGSNRSFCFAVY